MAYKVGSPGRNFLEGTGVSDSLYGDSSGTLTSRTSGGDSIHGYNGADYLYGDARNLRFTRAAGPTRSGRASTGIPSMATPTR